MNLVDLLALLCEVTGRPEQEVLTEADLGAAAAALVAMDGAGDDPFDRAAALAASLARAPLLVGTALRLAAAAAADVLEQSGLGLTAPPAEVATWLDTIAADPGGAGVGLWRLCQTDLVRLYFDDIAALPPLGDDEPSVRRCARAGDQHAVDRLIEAHLQLVVPIARQAQRRGDDLLDLIQEGNAGLVRAVLHDDGSAPFEVVATWWITHAIGRSQAA